jgi:peptidoglycan/LPS O-acetylase OafA/YrhL
MEHSKRTYFENLDGLHAIAAIAVILRLNLHNSAAGLQIHVAGVPQDYKSSVAVEKF